MIEESDAPETPLGLHKQALFSLHTIALIAMWLLTTVSLVLMLFSGVRNTGQFRVERYVLQAAYVLALFWYLIRTGPSLKQLPDLCPFLLPKLQIVKLIPVIVIALLIVAEFFGLGLLLPLLMLATIWILIAWRREIGLSAILLSLGTTTIALLAGLPFYQNQYIEKASFNGLITNDKFCMTRTRRLLLNWSRRPLRLRIPLTGEEVYSASEKSECGGNHETPVENSPEGRGVPGWPEPVGSSLFVSTGDSSFHNNSSDTNQPGGAACE